MEGLDEEPSSNFDPYFGNSEPSPVEPLSEEEAIIQITAEPDDTSPTETTFDNPIVNALLASRSEEALDTPPDKQPPAGQPPEEPPTSDKDTGAVSNSSDTEEPSPSIPKEANDGPKKPPTGGGGGGTTSGEDDEGESSFNQGYARPTDRPELARYLNDHPDTNVEAMVVLPHVPRLLGGLKSNQFIVKPPDTTPDTPPDPTEVVDLSMVVLQPSEFKSLIDFSEAVEAQADAQYPVALLETQQMIADAEERGATIDTIFVPDSPNEMASDYFRRLTRLAQDTNRAVVVPVVDYEEGYRYESYRRFEPIRAPSAQHYWDQRQEEIGPTMQRPKGIEPEPDDQAAIDALGNLTMPSGEYGSNMALGDQLATAAAASPQNLQRWLTEEESSIRDRLSVIKEVALSTTSSLENARGPARIILAKLGDSDTLQQIVQEVTTKTGGYGRESQTINPLGIYMRSDKTLLNDVLGQVEQALAQGPHEPHELLPWLGALYHSFDPAIGPTLADHLKVPDHHVENYATNALQAAGRWMPQYAQVLKTMPPSPQRDAALEAIQTRTQALLDAHNEGQLEGIYRPTASLAPMLFDFHNSEHEPTLREAVLQEFKRGGSVLNDTVFEQLYIRYREQYGDLPEITRRIHRS